MKAAVYNNYGPPEVAKVVDVEKPSPKENEVLVRVHASSVNRTDCGFRSAEYAIIRLFHGLVRPKHRVLGCEFAGTVESVGSSVTNFKIGDKVFGYDDVKWGGHAEYKVVAADKMIVKIPKGITFEEAAISTEGAHYALFYIRATKITADSHVLLYGATGAIGSAGLQLIKQTGAKITAVCAGKDVKLVKSLGADRVLNYEKEDFTKLTEKFDVVFDAVGKQTFAICKPLLKPKGIYTSTELGPHGQNPFLALTTRFSSGKRVMFPIPTNRIEDIEFLSKQMETGSYKPVIDRSYKLEEIAEAYRFVETGQKVGNVVIKLH